MKLKMGGSRGRPRSESVLYEELMSNMNPIQDVVSLSLPKKAEVSSKAFGVLM
jgi:hypothetical protein